MFSNSGLKFPKFENFDPLSENIDHPIWQLLLSIEKIRALFEQLQNLLNNVFLLTQSLFSAITIQWNMLDSSKAIHATCIQEKIIKATGMFSRTNIYTYFSESIGKEKFPNSQKWASITPAFRKGPCNSKLIINQCICLQYFLRNFRSFYKTNFKFSFATSYQSFRVVLVKRTKLLINDACDLERC